MKNLPSLTITCIAMLFASACITESKQEVSEQQESEVSQVISMPVFQHKAINSIYPYYLQIKEALTTGNISQARKAALLADKTLEHEHLNQKVVDAVQQILGSKNLDEQRQAFSVLSDELITEIDKTGMEDGVIYKAHCPMAFNDKGAYWLTNEEKILNPYFGDEMLTCGTIERTITRQGGR